MRPVKNITQPICYKGFFSKYIYTLQKYVPCTIPPRLAEYGVIRPTCEECPGQSEVTHTLEGRTHITVFCTHDIEAWRIQ